MRYVLVAPPTAEVVTLAEAKAHCRIDDTDSDALIPAYIAAAVQHLDGRAGILGRAILPQTWRIDARAPDCRRRLSIRMPNVTSVESVKYLLSGVETTWPTAEWRLGSEGNFFFVEAKPAFSWPSADDQEDAYRVTFVAGFADAAAVPAPIKAAVLLMVGDLFEHRETVVNGAVSVSAAVTLTVDRLINPYRIRSLGF